MPSEREGTFVFSTDGPVSTKQPTYYVQHPDGSFSVAEPQPKLFLVKAQPSPPVPSARTRFSEFDDDSHPFKIWWKKYGQFMQAGGNRYNEIFAARGWIAREQLAEGVEVTGECEGAAPAGPEPPTRIVTHEQAKQAAHALIDHYFHNKTERRVKICIPREMDDTDILLCDYIEQQASRAPSPAGPRWIPVRESTPDLGQWVTIRFEDGTFATGKYGFIPHPFKESPWFWWYPVAAPGREEQK